MSISRTRESNSVLTKIAFGARSVIYVPFNTHQSQEAYCAWLPHVSWLVPWAQSTTGDYIRANLSKLNADIAIYLKTSMQRGAGIACWLERQTLDQKVVKFESQQERQENFLLQSQLCVLTLIWCPFHPHVTTVARKRPRSSCQKCRWQVTSKHAYTLDPSKSE